MIQRDTYRSLTIFLGCWSLITSTSTAVLFNRLQDDPLHIGRHLATYNAFASMLALLGIIGAKQRNATLTTIFGNYLYLEILLSTIPRIITLTFFPAFRAQICSIDSIYAWLQSQRAPDPLLMAGRGLRAEDLLKQCAEVVVVLQVLMVVGLVLATVLQVVLAIRVARFARALREEEMRETALREIVLGEKRGEAEMTKSHVDWAEKV